MLARIHFVAPRPALVTPPPEFPTMSVDFPAILPLVFVYRVLSFSLSFFFLSSFFFGFVFAFSLGLVFCCVAGYH
jgi:energy-coupling factor transporter transmembrane protein EcfT